MAFRFDKPVTVTFTPEEASALYDLVSEAMSDFSFDVDRGNREVDLIKSGRAKLRAQATEKPKDHDRIARRTLNYQRAQMPKGSKR